VTQGKRLISEGKQDFGIGTKQGDVIEDCLMEFLVDFRTAYTISANFLRVEKKRKN